IALELHLRTPDISLDRALTALVARRRPALAHLVVAITAYDPHHAEPVAPRVPSGRLDAAALPALTSLRLRGDGLLAALDHRGLRQLRVEGYRALAGCGVAEPGAVHPLPALQELRIGLDRRAVAFLDRAAPALGVVPGDLRRLDLRGFPGWFDPQRRGGRSVAAFLERLADEGLTDRLEWLGLPALRAVDAVHVSRWRGRLPQLATLTVRQLDEVVRTELEGTIREIRVGERPAVWVDTIEAAAARERAAADELDDDGDIAEIVAALRDDPAALRELRDTLPSTRRDAVPAEPERPSSVGLPAGARARLGRRPDVAPPLAVPWPSVHHDGRALVVGGVPGFPPIPTPVGTPFALARDASRLAFARPDGSIETLARTGLPRTISTGRNVPVAALALTDRGDALASLAGDGALSLVEMTSGAIRSVHAVADAAGPIAWSGDDWLIVGLRDGRVAVLEARSGRRMATIRGHEAPCARIAADARFAASVGPARTIVVDLGRLAVSTTLEGDDAPSPRGAVRFVHGRLEARWGQRVQAFDPATGARLRARDRLRRVSALAVSPDGRWLGTSPDVMCWSIPAARPRERLGDARHAPGAIAFAPDGAGLAAIIGRGVQLFDEGGRQIGALDVEDPLDLGYAGPGRLVVAAVGGVSAWAVPRGRRLWHVQPPFRTVRLASAPDTVAVGAFANQLLQLDPASGAVVGRLDDPDPGSLPPTLHALAIVRGGEVVAASGAPFDRTWGLDRDARPLAPLRDLDDQLVGGPAMAWTSDGTRVAFARSREAAVDVYERRADRLARVKTSRLDGTHAEALVFTEDGALVSAGTDGTVLIWEP
ncbi:MAG: hypothetical protein AAF211_16825, partial [Myxococcota bacterium]